jgi:hypothetical protein
MTMIRKWQKQIGVPTFDLIKAGVSSLYPQPFFNRFMGRQRGFEPAGTISFDCDFPRDIDVLPDVLHLLDKYSCKASFACIGTWIRAYPEVHREIVAAGHEIINHTETHPNLYHDGYDYSRDDSLNKERFNEIAPNERLREIANCHATCVEILDYAPRGFRTPHFGALHIDDVYPILMKLGYAFSSSMLASRCVGGGAPYRTSEGIWEFPVSPCPGHPFGVLDSWHSISKNQPRHSGAGELAGLCERLCRVVERDGGYVNVYFDPKDVFESGELARILGIFAASGIPFTDYATLMGRLQRGDSVAESE